MNGIAINMLRNSLKSQLMAAMLMAGVLFPPATAAARLCTPDATVEAQRVFDYLQSVYGEKIISGAMAQVDWNIDNAESVNRAFGHYPAIAFFDYLHLSHSPSGWIDYGNISPVKDYWEAGGMVGACWHWNVPVSEGATQLTATASETSFSVSAALTEGTWEHNVLMADLAKMAGYLKLLRDADIALIWRPLHEAAGNIYEYNGGEAWFWWGHEGPGPFKRLWKYVHDYFQSEGLNNLIWVWTSQVKDRDFYPGDEYVDIVGRDTYNCSDQWKLSDEFKKLSAEYEAKMVVLSEMGNLAPLSQQWDAGARWGWFMPWYGNSSSLDGNIHADYNWWKEAMAMPQLVTRDQLPDFINGQGIDDDIDDDIKEHVIWTGHWTTSNWGGMQDLAWGGHDWSGITTGDKLVFHVESTGQDAVLKPSDSSWTELSCGFITIGNGVSTPAITLSDSDVAKLKNNGLVVSGNNIRLKKIVLVRNTSSVTTVHPNDGTAADSQPVMYDIHGRRVYRPKGLVIVNGRKIFFNHDN